MFKNINLFGFGGKKEPSEPQHDKAEEEAKEQQQSEKQSNEHEEQPQETHEQYMQRKLQKQLQQLRLLRQYQQQHQAEQSQPKQHNQEPSSGRQGDKKNIKEERQYEESPDEKEPSSGRQDDKKNIKEERQYEEPPDDKKNIKEERQYDEPPDEQVHETNDGYVQKQFQRLKRLRQQQKQPQQLPRRQYNILLFGETGSGKSTLINYLTNYFLKGSLEKLKIAIPTKYHRATEGWNYSEKDLHDATKSKTSECNVYDFIKGDIRFKFIDTPGLSDTEGTHKDDEHVMNIMAAAENSGSLAAIVIVMNGTVARVTVNLRNALNLLKCSIPDVLLDNLLVVLTNCDKSSFNFELKTLKPWIVPEENVFHMNNSALSKPRDDWIGDEDVKEDIQYQWEKSLKTIEKMVKRLTQLGSKATNAFGEMRMKRNKMKSELHELLLEVKKLQNIQNELNCMQFAQQDVATDIKKYANYRQTRIIEYEEMVPTLYHSTICMVHSIVCHDGCRLPFTSTPGTEMFKGCACMAGGSCLKCGCRHTDHYHDNRKPVKKSKTVEDIIHHVKALHDHHKSRLTGLKYVIDELHDDVETLKHALDTKELGIISCCTELKKICSQFNFVDELRGVIDTAERDARSLTNMSARKEAESRINNIKQLADRLSVRKELTVVEDTRRSVSYSRGEKSTFARHSTSSATVARVAPRVAPRVARDGGRSEQSRLFVGGLSWETSDEDLKDYFGQYGQIESVNIKTHPETGRSRGFAFIVFKSADSIDRVVAVDGHIINNKRVDPKKFDPKKGNARKDDPKRVSDKKSNTIAKKDDPKNGNEKKDDQKKVHPKIAKALPGKIFVGGLTNAISDDQIKTFFEQFGNLIAIQMPFDKEKNQRKGFCFITYDSEQVVEELLKTPQQFIAGKKVDIRKATEKPNSAHHSEGRGGMRGRPRGGMQGGREGAGLLDDE